MNPAARARPFAAGTGDGHEPKGHPMGKRTNLVIVRAGDKSLHPGWLEEEGERNWDLIVSYYGDDPAKFRDADCERSDAKGMKWPALHDLLASRPRLFTDYSYIWLPDDDLLTTKADVNRLFDICREYNLELAQPSLTWSSYTSYLTTLRNAGLLLRYTNFVEVMAPVLSSALLGRALASMGGTQTGWGLDYLWPRLATDKMTGVAIIDEVSVYHSRAVGGPLYAKMRSEGASPWDELRSFFRDHGLPDEHRIETYGAVAPGGKALRHRSPRGLALRLAIGHLLAVRQTPYRGFALRKLRDFVAANLSRSTSHPVEHVRPLAGF